MDAIVKVEAAVIEVTTVDSIVRVIKRIVRKIKAAVASTFTTLRLRMGNTSLSAVPAPSQEVD